MSQIPVTQIIHLRNQRRVEGHLFDDTKWHAALDLVQSAPGFERMYWGESLEHPERVALHAVAEVLYWTLFRLHSGNERQPSYSSKLRSSDKKGKAKQGSQRDERESVREEKKVKPTKKQPPVDERDTRKPARSLFDLVGTPKASKSDDRHKSNKTRDRTPDSFAGPSTKPRSSRSEEPASREDRKLAKRLGMALSDASHGNKKLAAKRLRRALEELESESESEGEYDEESGEGSGEESEWEEEPERTRTRRRGRR
ncbi:hypothetical protein Slin15195_G043500 [Septoria linicola]|uniref:Uncharacterized protein n=1 Tax=Septoria linicola TaxID=215465 RepID=A0A9Q9EGQ1_9PEZI|nr:hypothetical protein Slin14017_G047020 [Septoria linicola]USW51031.1 hypothetical protein Slin15195_G043500 [Septoria linicola]